MSDDEHDVPSEDVSEQPDPGSLDAVSSDSDASSLAKSRMPQFVAWVVLAAGAGFGIGLTIGNTSGPSRVDYAAEEFCALGDGSGASLFDVAGWVKAAQRTNDDWDAVIDAIDDRCLLWRLQVAERSSDLGS